MTFREGSYDFEWVGLRTDPSFDDEARSPADDRSEHQTSEKIEIQFEEILASVP